MTQSKPTIALIGAGLSGLIAAHQLRKHATVTLFEKSRGVSGRMSTRYAGEYFFDHGAPYFTATSNAFRNFLQPYRETGLITPWQPERVVFNAAGQAKPQPPAEPYLVASPRMNQWCKTLAEPLDIRLQTEIAPLTGTSYPWSLTDKEGHRHGPYDWVLCTAPAPQCHTLMPPAFSDHDMLKEVQMTGCYSLMIGLDTPLPFSWQLAEIENSPLQRIIVNSSKPGRALHPTSILAHSTSHWAEAHIDEDIPAMQIVLVDELCRLTGLQSSAFTHIATHRWRYARANHTPIQPSNAVDANHQLACTGDWLIGDDIESAFLAATQASDSILGNITE